MPLAPGARLGPYEIISALGAGGMGEVYLADDPRLHRQVAIKVLNARFAGDEGARGRFLREAQMAAGLDHPNICTLHEVGTENGCDYLVMQRLSGDTLAGRLRREQPSPAAAFDIAVQLTEALACAHAHGVVHRDIKPHNVMITSDGRVKLMDFGLAKPAPQFDGEQATRTTLSGVGTFLGTIEYMSPEQLAGQAGDMRSDVFSLGLTLFELFAGRHPFSGPTPIATASAIANRPAPLITSIATAAPRGLAPILAKAMAHAPGDRYQSGVELLADLNTLASSGRIDAERTGPRRRRALTLILTTILLAAVPVIVVERWRFAAKGMPAVATAPSLSMWMELQPSEAGMLRPAYESLGGDVLANGSKFRVHLQPSVPGSVYLVSDERPQSTRTPQLSLLYPMPDSAARAAGITTDWYVVGGPPADIAVWIVWSREALAELQSLTTLVNAKDLGIVRDLARAEAVRLLLTRAASTATARVDPSRPRLVVTGSTEVIVHRFSLREQ